MKKTLVIGDVHGHYSRLTTLLEREGIIAWDPTARDHKRVNHDVEVVQLGDLGHFGKTGSPTGDELCWLAAYDGWVDVVLWGNHDRAVVDGVHAFTGYELANPGSIHNYMSAMNKDGRLKLAHEAHGWLLTHAGLHSKFKHQNVSELAKVDPEAFADWINREDQLSLSEGETDPEAIAIRDCVGRYRGGGAEAGGILWRDFNESLYRPFKQVFGHSKGEKVRKDGDSWCVDIGSSDNGRLAGIYLPEEKVVEVNLNVR